MQGEGLPPARSLAAACAGESEVQEKGSLLAHCWQLRGLGGKVHGRVLSATYAGGHAGVLEGVVQGESPLLAHPPAAARMCCRGRCTGRPPATGWRLGPRGIQWLVFIVNDFPAAFGLCLNDLFEKQI